jgi:hypothetical protein
MKRPLILAKVNPVAWQWPHGEIGCYGEPTTAEARPKHRPTLELLWRL